MAYILINWLVYARGLTLRIAIIDLVLLDSDFFKKPSSLKASNFAWTFSIRQSTVMIMHRGRVALDIFSAYLVKKHSGRNACRETCIISICSIPRCWIQYLDCIPWESPLSHELNWCTLWKIDLCCLTLLLNFLSYTGNTSWSAALRKSIELMLVQTIKTKCSWLKHDCDYAVDEAADFTGCVCNIREGIVSPTRESREGRLFLHEYHVEECCAVPLDAVIANSCKLDIPLLPLPFPGRGIGAVAQDWAELTSLSFCLCCVVRKLSLMQLVLAVRNNGGLAWSQLTAPLLSLALCNPQHIFGRRSSFSKQIKTMLHW